MHANDSSPADPAGCRPAATPSWTLGRPASPPWHWHSCSTLRAVGLHVASAEVPWLQDAFSTVSLDPVHWTVCVDAASLALRAEEAREPVVPLVSRNR